MSRTSNRTPILPADALTGTYASELHDTEGLDREVTLSGDMSLEDLRDQLNKPGTMDIETADFKSFAEELAFMNEQVLIRIEESTDKNAEKIVFVSNDGIPQRFVRGEWVIAKRKYAEVLARSKPFSVATPEINDGNGDRTTSIRTNVAQMYPFTMRDKNPRGEAWLNRVKQEA